MILPSSYGVLLLLLIIGMLAWGTWANTLKASGGNWRFELFSLDFALGVIIAAVVLALTLGSLGFDGFSFTDDLRLAGKRQDVLAFAAGVVFNLGNMLLMGALSLAGMMVAFGVSMGFALAIGTIWSVLLNGGNAVLSGVGAAIALSAVVIGILAYREYARAKFQAELRALQEQLQAQPPTPGKSRTKVKKSNVSGKAIALSLGAGLMLGSFSPLAQLARQGENGLGPYSMGFILSIGIFFSTFVFNLFFMNLPIKGEPIDIVDYFRAGIRQHVPGLLGGILWYIGAIAVLLESRVDGPAKVQPSIGYALSQGGIIIAAICGLLIWKEFADADYKVKTYLGLALVLLAIGIGLVSTGAAAPAY
jgi:glucose uptake protein